MSERAERRKGSFYVLVDLSAHNLSAPPKKAAILSSVSSFGASFAHLRSDAGG